MAKISPLSTNELIQKNLSTLPYIEDLLAANLINISALSEYLQAKIKNNHGIKISLAAIGMAIRRTKFKEKSTHNYNHKFPKNLDVSTKSGIYEVAFAQQQLTFKSFEKLRSEIIRKGGLATIFQGVYETVLVTNQEYKTLVSKVVPKKIRTSERDNLAFVTVKWPESTKDIPGIYYRITRALAFAGISIQSFHTIGAEMMILIKANVLLAAHQVIQDVLDGF